MAKLAGLKLAIEALQGLDENQRQKIIQEIAKRDPKVASALKEGSFDFSKLQYLTKHDFQVLWWEVPRLNWYQALRMPPTGLLDRIQSFLTKRAFEELQQEIKNLGPIPKKVASAAQNEIVVTLLDLVAQNKITLPTKKNNDPMA